MNKKIYSSPETKLVKIQLKTMLSTLSGVSENGQTVTFGTGTGSVSGAAAKVRFDVGGGDDDSSDDIW